MQNGHATCMLNGHATCMHAMAPHCEVSMASEAAATDHLREPGHIDCGIKSLSLSATRTSSACSQCARLRGYGWPWTSPPKTSFRSHCELLRNSASVKTAWACKATCLSKAFAGSSADGKLNGKESNIHGEALDGKGCHLETLPTKTEY
eukprot:3859217-Pleurochrysis_carterae.AAC.2